MTRIEAYYQKQRNKGLLVSFMGFIIAIAPVLLNSIFEIAAPLLVLIVGYVIGLLGIALYMRAFIAGLKYTQSEQYKKDLTPKQPWDL